MYTPGTRTTRDIVVRDFLLFYQDGKIYGNASMAAQPRLVVHFYPFVIQRMRRGKNDQHCVVLEEQKRGDG